MFSCYKNSARDLDPINEKSRLLKGKQSYSGKKAYHSNFKITLKIDFIYVQATSELCSSRLITDISREMFQIFIVYPECTK